MASSVGSLAEKVIFITGASRGIGRSIALRAAADGAKLILAAKTIEPHPKLPGTLREVAQEVVQLGGEALPCAVDVRNEEQVQEAISNAVKRFGGIDILVNNASAIALTNTTDTPMKSYDLMMDINVRGTYLCSKLAIPYLIKGRNPHILNLSPPLNMNPKWFSSHVAYTMSKYGMSMCVLGMHRELRKHNIAVNALWPRTAIYTAATRMLFSDGFAVRCRKPEIMADAAHAILTLPSSSDANTGNFFIDEDLLRSRGVTDFENYSVQKGATLAIDLFVENTETDSSAAPKPASSQNSAQKKTVADVFNDIKLTRSPAVIEQVNATFAFKLSGSEPGVWLINLKSLSGEVKKLESSVDETAVDCSFELPSEDFIALFNGTAYTSDLFAAGKLIIEGDLTAALRLDKQLTQLRKA
nr:unnamed protein product [Spirometra erinaceieuropaei]